MTAPSAPTSNPPTADTPADDPPELGGHDPMGRRVGSAAIWMILATVIGKGAAVVAQVLMGILLAKDDFALYAYAAAATKLLSICQDAGIRDLLIQSGDKQYRRLSGPIFWFAAAFNTSVALLIAAATPLVAMYYDEERLRSMMWILLLSIPLGTPAAVLSAKLRIDLRFQETSIILTISAVTRQVGQIALALAAYGAMSFIYPAVLAAVLDSLMYWWVARDRPWGRAPQVTMWPELVRRTRYLILGSVANLLLDQGPYLVLQPALRMLGGMPKEAADHIQADVFWAFQMTAQIGVLLSFNMQLVLSPVFQRLKDDAERLRASLVRSLAAMMMLGSLASVALGVLMDPLEKMVFQGKWQSATLAVAVYGVFFPFRILYGLTNAVQLGAGRTREYFWTTLVEGLVFTLSAVFAGVFVTTSTGVAWWTGGALALGMILTSLWILGRFGISTRSAMPGMMLPWALAVVSGAAAWAVDQYLPLREIPVRAWSGEGEAAAVVVTINHIPGVFGDLAQSLLDRGLTPKNTARVIEAGRMLVMGAVCSAVFAAAARAFMPAMLGEMINVAPRPLRALARRVLLMPGSEG